MWYICVRNYQCAWHSSDGWVTSSPLWINQCKIEDKSGKENASVIKCLSMVMEFARPTLNPRRCDSRGTSLEKSPGPRYAHCHLSTCWHLVSQLESRSHFWIPGQITYMKRSSVKFELSNQDGSNLFTKATFFLLHSFSDYGTLYSRRLCIWNCDLIIRHDSRIMLIS